jgi:hypothetical protein
MPHILSLGGSYDVDTESEPDSGTDIEDSDDGGVTRKHFATPATPPPRTLSLGDEVPASPPRQSFDVYEPAPAPAQKSTKVVPDRGAKWKEKPPRGMSPHQLEEASLCPPGEYACPSWKERKESQEQEADDSDEWERWVEEMDERQTKKKKADVKKQVRFKEAPAKRKRIPAKRKSTPKLTWKQQLEAATRPPPAAVGPPRLKAIVSPMVGGIPMDLASIRKRRKAELARGPSKFMLMHKTVPELKDLLRARTLRVGGTKEVLIARLVKNR